MRFEEPPKIENNITRPFMRKYDWPTIAAELKKHPGKWGIVDGVDVKGTPESAQATARYIRSGRNAHTPPTEFETVTRKNVVYVRYVGKP